jgi:hypothetical protein
MDCPVHSSAISHTPSSPRQGVPCGDGSSVGQSVLMPSQASVASHRPVAVRQTMPLFAVPQVPSAVAPAATLHASQSPALPPPQAVSQQTPSTQNPLRHSMLAPQAVPLERGGMCPH